MGKRMKTPPRSGRRNAMWVIAAVSFFGLVLHLASRWSFGTLKDGLDAIALGLIALMLTPWVVRIVESVKFGGVEMRFLQEQIDDNRNGLEELRFLFINLLTSWELHHLKALADQREFIVDVDYYPENLKAELLRLRRLGLIEAHEGKSIAAIYDDPRKTKSLHEYFHITDTGRDLFSGCRGVLEHTNQKIGSAFADFDLAG